MNDFWMEFPLRYCSEEQFSKAKEDIIDERSIFYDILSVFLLMYDARYNLALFEIEGMKFVKAIRINRIARKI